MARAVGERGWVTSFEIDGWHAGIARGNLEQAGVEVVVGPAAESAWRLVEEGHEPYDFGFIDADKPSNPES